jgi:hypothetical protein
MCIICLVVKLHLLYSAIVTFITSSEQLQRMTPSIILKKIGKLCAMLSAFYNSEVATTATTRDWALLCCHCSGQSSTQGGVHETHEAHAARCLAVLIQSLLYIKLYQVISRYIMESCSYNLYVTKWSIYNPWKMCVDFLLSRRQA